MKAARLRLKHPVGWFAAGREVAHALTLLSDAAFKVFVWLCLHADRSRGALRVEPQEIAGAVGKSEAEIAALVEELLRQGICRRTADGRVEITDSFWPYERATPSQGETASAYLAAVKKLLRERACVRSAFTAADQKLALELHGAGVPLQRVEQAIHLGCLRKYAALLNRPGGTPITTLHYFAETLAEVQRMKVSDEYWHYVAAKLSKLERQWRQSQTAARPNFTAAGETK